MPRLKNFPLLLTGAQCGDQVDTPLNPQIASLPCIGDKLIFDYTHASQNQNTTKCRFEVAGVLVPATDSPDQDVQFDNHQCCATLTIERISQAAIKTQLDWKATLAAENNTGRFSGGGIAVEIEVTGEFAVEAIGRGLDGDLIQTMQDAYFYPANP